MSAYLHDAPGSIRHEGEQLAMTPRQRIRSFVRLNFCGTRSKPADWGLIVARTCTNLKGIPAASVALALAEEFPDLYAAIVTAHGEFDPEHRGPAKGRGRIAA